MIVEINVRGIVIDMSVYDEGIDARMKGIRFDKNPYAHFGETLNHFKWRQGWMDAGDGGYGKIIEEDGLRFFLAKTNVARCLNCEAYKQRLCRIDLSPKLFDACWSAGVSLFCNKIEKIEGE